jgi:hypothetical protein
MALFERKKPCKNCGSKKLHRECFSGGTKTTIFLDDKARSNIHKKVELNVARGHDRYKGLSSSERKIYLSQDPGRH